MTQESENERWARRGDAVVMATYARQPVAFSHGRGATLWDVDGRDYIDLCAGIAVSALGHAHPRLTAAIADQAGKLLHVSNLYQVPEQIALAEALKDFLNYDRFFFCNSGAEANESALKLARAWGKPRGRHRVVVAEGGFHGRTLGALSATAQEKFQAPFLPLLPGIDVVPFGDVAMLERALQHDTAAVLIEPAQAEGGGVFATAAYLAGVRAACDRAGVLLMFDEVQTGMGRTGAPLYSTSLNVRADAVTLAKGLGGGVPIGALAVTAALADVLGPGTHASTFGGNPLVTRAAQVVVATLAQPGFLDGTVELGTAMCAEVAGWSDLGVRDVRGRGLFIFCNVPDATAAVRAAREHGVLVAAAKGTSLRLLPPLTITRDEAFLGLGRLRRALESLQRSAA